MTVLRYDHSINEHGRDFRRKFVATCSVAANDWNIFCRNPLLYSMKRWIRVRAVSSTCAKCYMLRTSLTKSLHIFTFHAFGANKSFFFANFKATKCNIFSHLSRTNKSGIGCNSHFNLAMFYPRTKVGAEQTACDKNTAQNPPINHIKCCLRCVHSSESAAYTSATFQRHG